MKVSRSEFTAFGQRTFGFMSGLGTYSSSSSCSKVGGDLVEGIEDYDPWPAFIGNIIIEVN